MRRKSTGPKIPSGAFDVINDISPEKLQTFAAILILWNYVETILDTILGYTLGLKVDLFFHVSSRINGIDRKIALCKEGIRAQGASDAVRLTTSKTLNALARAPK
jgi:hypothetical protein